MLNPYAANVENMVSS